MNITHNTKITVKQTFYLWVFEYKMPEIFLITYILHIKAGTEMGQSQI